MTAQELIAKLSKLAPATQVMILEGSNGNGIPREINFGPALHTVEERDSDDTADCDDLVGESVAVIGYGCY